MGVKTGVLKKIIAGIAIGLIIIGCTACGAEHKTSSTTPSNEPATHESTLEILNQDEDGAEWKYDSSRKAYILYETTNGDKVSRWIRDYKKYGEVPGWDKLSDAYESLAKTLASTTKEDCYLIIADPTDPENCVFAADKDGVIFDGFKGYKRGE